MSDIYKRAKENGVTMTAEERWEEDLEFNIPITEIEIDNQLKEFDDKWEKFRTDY